MRALSDWSALQTDRDESTPVRLAWRHEWSAIMTNRRIAVAFLALLLVLMPTRLPGQEIRSADDPPAGAPASLARTPAAAINSPLADQPAPRCETCAPGHRRALRHGCRRACDADDTGLGSVLRWDGAAQERAGGVSAKLRPAGRCARCSGWSPATAWRSGPTRSRAFAAGPWFGSAAASGSSQTRSWRLWSRTSSS